MIAPASNSLGAGRPSNSIRDAVDAQLAPRLSDELKKNHASTSRPMSGEIVSENDKPTPPRSSGADSNASAPCCEASGRLWNVVQDDQLRRRTRRGRISAPHVVAEFDQERVLVERF